MTMRLTLATLIWAAISVIASAQGSIGVADAKTLAKIRAQEAVVGQKQDNLKEANRRLQDDYQRLNQLFSETKNGENKNALMDLVRVLEEPVKAANDSLMAGRKGKRLLREFTKKSDPATKKVEHELLSSLKTELSASVSRVFTKQMDAKVSKIEVMDFSRAVIADLFPNDLPFWKIWNEKLLSSMPNREGYVAAFDRLTNAQTALTVLKDPKMKYTVGAPEGMALIPTGNISIVSEYGFSAKKRKTKVKSFYIDVKEVTHGEFWGNYWVHLKDKATKSASIPIFTDARGREQKQWVQDPETGEYAPIKERMNWPVTGIDAKTARAYAAYVGKRLPREAEWMAAATATPGKTSKYPWGEKWVPDANNDAKLKRKSPNDVGSYPRGRSFYGLYDVAGNVKEWLDTTVKGKDADKLDSGTILVVRGGSFKSSDSGVSLKWRWQLPALGTRNIDLGFRCAKDLEIK